MSADYETPVIPSVSGSDDEPDWFSIAFGDESHSVRAVNERSMVGAQVTRTESDKETVRELQGMQMCDPTQVLGPGFADVWAHAGRFRRRHSRHSTHPKSLIGRNALPRLEMVMAKVRGLTVRNNFVIVRTKFVIVGGHGT